MTGPAFDDPTAWGFCRYCAFEVGVDAETGKMLMHQRMQSGFRLQDCEGAYEDPTEQTSPEMEPVPRERPSDDDDEDD